MTSESRRLEAQRRLEANQTEAANERLRAESAHVRKNYEASQEVHKASDEANFLKREQARRLADAREKAKDVHPHEPYFRVEGLTGGTSNHRRTANEKLATELRTNSDNREAMRDRFGKDVLDHMESGKGQLKNPPECEWHHPKDSPSTVILLRKEVHRAPENREILHEQLQSGQWGGGGAKFHPRKPN